ncbi:MAG: hypothetical protein JXB07_16410 [Anaerolineae bacterium]|nr:hypothetical protein [Anaerolineae bacterium]
MESDLNWLLEGPAWVAYRTRLDLLDEPEDDPQVIEARRTMIADTQVKGLLAELSDWPGVILKNHKSAGHPPHPSL